MAKLSKLDSAIIADCAAKLGMRLAFITEYLEAMGYTGRNLASAIVSERVGEIPMRSVEAALLNGAALPGVRY